VATLAARNENEATVASMVVSDGVCIWRKYGVWSQAFGFVLAFCTNLASAALKMFSYLIYVKNKFYKFCIFNAICKENAAVNCITVQHPLTFTGHTTLGKGKAVPLRTMEAPGGRGGIAPTHSQPRH
jgi:hypothetical protein